MNPVFHKMATSTTRSAPLNLEQQVPFTHWSSSDSFAF